MTREELQQRYNQQKEAAKNALLTLLTRKNEELHQAREEGAQQQEEATREYYQQVRPHQDRLSWLLRQVRRCRELENADEAVAHWKEQAGKEHEAIDTMKAEYQKKVRDINARTHRRTESIRLNYEMDINDQKTLLHSLRQAYFLKIAEEGL